jgi:hypothetical protein
MTGDFNGTFAVAGVLAQIGAGATLTRRPIVAATTPIGARLGSSVRAST